MRYPKLVLGICFVAPLLLAAGILWRDSEQQYVAMTNLGHRLEVLHQTLSEGRLPDQKYRPSWEMAWKPMVTAMQFEARHALAGGLGFHLSRPMKKYLSGFSEKNIGDETELKKILSQADFSDAAFEASAPLVFSGDAQRYSSSSQTAFRQEITDIVSNEAEYSDWLTPILYKQQMFDKLTTCKTLKEIKAFQTYSVRLKNKCANNQNKWTVCGGENEPIARQLKELRVTLESNLNKYKSRWSVENVNVLCADL